MVKHKISLNTIILIIIAFILLVGVLGFFFGWFEKISLSLTTTPKLEDGVEAQLETTTVQVDPDCSLVFSPTTANVGDIITAIIRDGKNTNCAIYYNFNSGAWVFLNTIRTDARGSYTATQVAGAAGVYEFAAICTGCVTNKAIVTINIPPADSDGDGFSDDEESSAGTDPNDSSDYPGSEDTTVYTCGQGIDQEVCQGTCPGTYPRCVELEFQDGVACACINEDAQEVHPDWKPGGQYHNLVPYDGSPDGESAFCFDNDFHLGFPAKLKVKSSCQDSTGTTWDYCDGNMVHDLFCDGNDCSDALAQSCTTYAGTGSECIDGACTTPQTIGQYCSDLGFDRHWDNPGEGNCNQAAINYCTPKEHEYFYDAVKEWCCYKCETDDMYKCRIKCTETGFMGQTLPYYAVIENNDECNAYADTQCSGNPMWFPSDEGFTDCCCWDCN